jgi:hypothetical protein
MASLRDLYGAPIQDDIARVSNASRPIARSYSAIQNARHTLRANLTAETNITILVTNVNNSTNALALAKLDTMAVAIEPEFESLREERKQLEDRLASGREFFDAAIKGIEAWTQTHGDLAEAFKENRRPNLVLLMARAEELNTIITELRK